MLDNHNHSLGANDFTDCVSVTFPTRQTACLVLCVMLFCVLEPLRWCKLSLPGLPLQTKTFFHIRWNMKGLALPLKNLSHTEQWLDERTNQGRLTATETLCGESHYCVNNRWSPPNPSADCCLRACQAGRHAASCNVVTRDYRARRDSNYDTSQLSSRPYNFFAMLTQR